MIQKDRGATRYAGGNSGIVWRKSPLRETWFGALFPVFCVLLIMLTGNVPVFARGKADAGAPAAESAGAGETLKAEMSGTETAQSGGILRISPDEAVERAVKHNLSLESNRVSVETKKRASDTAWNVFIPSVTVAGSLIRDNTVTSGTTLYPVPLPGVPQGTLYGVVPYPYEASRWHVAGSIQTSLNVNFAMLEAMRRLRLDYEGGLLSYEKARFQLERDVRKSYYQMLLLQENIALLR
jgi:outer membrane protein TolC